MYTAAMQHTQSGALELIHTIWQLMFAGREKSTLSAYPAPAPTPAQSTAAAAAP